MMRNHTAHLIWDWNGTMLDDTDACLSTINHMLGKRGLQTITRTRYRDLFDFPVQACYRVLGFDFDVEDWNAVSEEYHARYAIVSKDSPLRKGTQEILAGAVARGIGMSVLSASETSILLRMMEEREVLGYFDNVVGLSDLYARSKLDVGRALVAGLPVSPGAALMIGDTTHDYEVARELGCRCVLLEGGHQSRQRLERCDCPVISDPAELRAFF